MKYIQSNILRKMFFCLILLFLVLINATVTHADNYTFVTKWGSKGTSAGYFYCPDGVAVDSSSNVYVADSYNNRIQKFDSNGNFVKYIGDQQSAATHTPGSGPGQFDYPSGVAVDRAGYVYVADTGNHRIQMFDSNGRCFGLFGSYGSQEGLFQRPGGVAVDLWGNIYVADTNNHRIQKFNSAGAFITKWGSNGTNDRQFSYPDGIAVDSLGNVYVADTGNDRIQKFNSTGAFITKWGSEGTDDGQFYAPCDIAVDSLSYVYVVDGGSVEFGGNHRIQKFVLRRTTPTITWNNPANISYGTPLSSTQLNAVATDPVTGNIVPGTFRYTPKAGGVLGLGTYKLHVDFTPTDLINYYIASKDVTINVVRATPRIIWNTPANIIYGTPLSNTQLNAWASVPGTFNYTPKAGTVLSPNYHTLFVDFTPNDTTKYTTAYESVDIYVVGTTPTITWNTPANISYGTPLSSTQLNAVATDSVTGNTIPGTFDYTPKAGTVLGAGSQRLNVYFTPSDIINYITASKYVTITIDKATPTIVWNNPVDIIYGTALNDTQLNATASVPGTFNYTPEVGTLLDIGSYTLHVDFTPTDAANYTTVSKNVTINVSDIKIFKAAGTYYNCSSWSNNQYPFINLFGEKYVPLVYGSIWNCKLQKLAKLVLDNDFRYVLKNGEQLDLGQGYSLTAKQVDVDGKKVWLEFDKDGQYVDDQVVDTTNSDKTWTCTLDHIQNEDDVQVLKVHVNSVFQGAVDSFVQIDGIWLIDYANATTLMIGGQFGNYTIMEVNNGLNESNPGNIVFKKTTSLP